MSFKTGCVNVYVTTFSREPTYDSTRRGMTQGRIKNTHIWESKRWIPAKFEPDSPEMTSLKMSMLAESGRVGVDRTGGVGVCPERRGAAAAAAGEAGKGGGVNGNS